jgi:hypothetical protein
MWPWISGKAKLTDHGKTMVMQDVVLGEQSVRVRFLYTLLCVPYLL